MNIGQIYREESARILATLIRLLGDFDLAEKVMQEAFAAALEPWPAQEEPACLAASTARNKAVDRPRGARCERKEEELQRLATVQERLAIVPEYEAEDAMLGGGLLLFTARWSRTRLSAFLPST